MPRLEPKAIQKELQSDKIRSVYWIYGPEAMKIDELIKKIRHHVVGDARNSLAEERLDGSEVHASAILDSARTPAFFGQGKLLIIHQAHQIKELERLEPLLQETDLPSTCVFVAKDLDGRKKFSKKLLASAAVVECSAVADAEREAWIRYLAKRHNLSLAEDQLDHLISTDPWSLHLMDGELQKMSLAVSSEDASALMPGSLGIPNGTTLFLEAFFKRDRGRALELLEHFAHQPEQSFPLMGLLNWNIRHLIAIKQGERPKLHSFVLNRLQDWATRWETGEIKAIQSQLARLDFELKQTATLPWSAWTNLVLEQSETALADQPA